jgi:hypothetical protein
MRISARGQNPNTKTTHDLDLAHIHFYDGLIIPPKASGSIDRLDFEMHLTCSLLFASCMS